MRMLTPWVGGTKGPKGGGPGGQGAAHGRTRAARAHGRTRALRALGPFGPLGPLGAKGDRLYATKAMPNGIDNTDERYSVNVSRFPPVWIPYGSVRGYYLFCPKTANLHEAEIIENLPETYQLEHLGGLGPEIV